MTFHHEIDFANMTRAQIVSAIGWTCYHWNRVSLEETTICANLMSTLPVSIGQVAQSLGIPVIASSLPYQISGQIELDVTTASGMKIKVNRHENRFRQRFTVAHEIGHYLLHRDEVFENNGVNDSIMYRSELSDALETQANQIAADLLLPKAAIYAFAMQEYGVTQISENMAPYMADYLNVSKIAFKIRFGLI